MGLDMYLMKSKKVGDLNGRDISLLSSYFAWLDYKSSTEKPCSLKDWCGREESELKDINLYLQTFKDRLDNPYDDLGYWRKANAIHQWFVDNVQGGVDNCQSYDVSKDQLEELLDTCEDVLNQHYQGNNEEAKNSLPTQEGFFFGDTAYDEYYFESIQDTIDIIKKVLDDVDFTKELVVYCSSW